MGVENMEELMLDELKDLYFSREADREGAAEDG